MQNEMQLVKQEPQSVERAEPRIADMLQAVIEKGVTGESVGALEKLMDLYERTENRNAEKAFNSAFTKLQSELPVIVAKSVIPNRGKYERFEDVMDAIGKHLVANGFSVAFTQSIKDNRTVVTCTLRHIAGHKQSNDFAVRCGGKADSDTQADCKAATTAKRNALLQALNIIIRQDCLNEEHDAAIEGNPNEHITTAQADELERRVQLVNGNVQAFLKFAQADSFKNIAAHRYAELDTMLARKERTGR